MDTSSTRPRPGLTTACCLYSVTALGRSYDNFLEALDPSWRLRLSSSYNRSLLAAGLQIGSAVFKFTLESWPCWEN